jgi:hypothetical protein
MTTSALPGTSTAADCLLYCSHFRVYQYLPIMTTSALPGTSTAADCLLYCSHLSVFTYNDNISATRNLNCCRLSAHQTAMVHIPEPSVIVTAFQTDWADLQNKQLISFSFVLYLLSLSVNWKVKTWKKRKWPD